MTDLFYRACETGNLEALRGLVAKDKFNVNLLDNFDGVGAGFSGLHYAARGGKNDVIRFICSKKGNVNCLGSDGGAPLHWACRSNKPTTVKLLLELGANPNLRGKFGKSALHVSTNKDHVECLEILLAASDIDVNLSDNLKDVKFGTTALHLAASSNRTACMKALLRGGANVEALNNKQQTPLHLACCSTSSDNVELLMDAGSDVSAKDIDHASPLFHACYHGNMEIVKRLSKVKAIDLTLKNEAGETALHWAAAGGWVNIVRILVDAGAYVNIQSAKGLTALHFAAKNGHFETCQMLVKMKCEVEAQDKLGQTALALAGKQGQAGTVEQLIKAGASIETRDNRGASPLYLAVQENRVDVTQCLTGNLTKDVISLDYDHALNTPLHVAAEKGHHVCLKLLLVAGYDMSKNNKDGFTATHLAAREGRIETMREMLNWNKECVQYEDEMFNQPLHRAAKHGFSQTCRLLLDAGAQVNKGNNGGVTPLHFAAMSGGSRVCEVLLKSGAAVNALDNNEDTPLHYATRAGDAESTRLLVVDGAKLQQQNELHENPLLTAIKSNNDKCVSAIVDAPHWRASFEDRPGLDAAETDDSGWQDCSTLHQLIIHFPEHARSVFDKCTSADHNISSNSENYWVKFDYSLLEGQINHPFSTMLEYGKTELLDHPLVSSLLNYKWSTYGRGLYYINLLLYVLYLISITSYCMLEETPKSFAPRQTTLLTVLAGAVVLFSVSRIILELLQLVKDPLDYIKSPTNYMEVGLYIMSMVFVSNSFYKDVGPDRTQWEIGCFVIVFAWLSLALFLRKSPSFGSRIIMFTTVFASFLKVLPFIMIFLVAYSLGFYMCLGDEFGTFRAPGYSMLKSHIMFMGEINFDMYFVPLTLESAAPVNYPYATFTILPLFIVCMPLLLMNLLVGLAVDDISESLRAAKLEHSARLVEGVFNAEALLPKKALPEVRHPTGKLYPNRKLWYGGSPLHLKAVVVEEILARKKHEEDESKRNVDNKIISTLSQIKEQLSLLSNNMLEGESMVESGILDINSIHIAHSKIFDKEH